MLTDLESALTELFNIRILKEQRPELSAQYRMTPLGNTGYFLYVDKSLDHETVSNLKPHLESILARFEQLETIAAEHTLLSAELKRMGQATRSGFDLEMGIEREFEFVRDFGAEYALLQEDRVVVNSGLDPHILETARRSLAEADAFELFVKQEELVGYSTEVFRLVVLSPRPLSETLKDILQAKLWWLTQAHRQTTSELEVIFHTFPDVYFRLDSEGIILDYKAHPSIPLPPDILGKPVQDVAPYREMGHLFAQAVRQVRQTKSIVSFEYPFTVQGRRYFHGARLAPLGKTQIVAIIRDITERKKAEEALRRSEERFRLMFEAAPDGITILDERGVIVDCNPAALRLYDRPAEEVIGQHIADFVTSPFKGVFKEVMPLLQQLEPQEREIQVLRADGSVVDVWRKVTPIVGPEGDFKGILVYDRDITALKRAEAELRKLYRAVEQSVSTIVITDLNGTIEFVNPAFSRITGYSAEEAIGQNPRILKSGRHPPEFYREMWDTLIRGDVWQGELINKKKNGELYWEAATISPVKDETGRTTHYLAVKEDITERKRAEEELRIKHRQQQILNTLLQISLEDLSLAEQLERVLQEILTIPWLPLLPRGGIFLVEDDPEVLTLQVQQNLGSALQTMCARVPFGRCLCGRAAATRRILFTDCMDERHENVYEGITPHGHYNVPIVSGQEVLGVVVLYLPEGHKKTEGEVSFLQAIASTLAGMIRRKRTEEELRLRRRQAETLRAATQVLSSTLDLSQVFELILSELQKVVPYDSVAVQQLKGDRLEIIGCRGFPNPEEIIGISFDLTKDDSPNREVIETREPLILHNPAAKYPAFQSDPHASAHIASWLGVPLLFGDRPIGMISVDKQEPGFYHQEHARLAMAFAAQAAVAIENARLFDEVQRAKEAALEASRLKSQILAAVNHDLRTPLGAILGYTELLQGGAYGSLSDRQQEVVTKVLDSAYYLTDLVNDLLDGAQLEAGRLELNIAPFNLPEMVGRVESRMNVLAQKKGLALAVEVAPDMPTMLSGDEKRLQRILSNLLGNAIKFTETGEVRARIYRLDPNRWAMQVTDTGPGIPPEAQAYIFEAFRQVDNSLTRRPSGSGLGLSIVKQLVEMMGGEIALESKVGQGSTFTVMLPLTLPQEEIE